MGDHLHIHIPKAQPSIQEELNSFLQQSSKQYLKSQVTQILLCIAKYIEHYSSGVYNVLNLAVLKIEEDDISTSMTLISKGIEELRIYEEMLEEEYQNYFIDNFHAIKCLPLSIFVLEQINRCLIKTFNSM